MGEPTNKGNVRAQDFATRYANNVQFEATALDLTMVFGRFDSSEQPSVIRQHTAVSMTWAEAKLALYYLQINIAIHEADNGTVTVPRGLIPPPFTLGPELAETPAGKMALERTAKILGDFKASL